MKYIVCDIDGTISQVGDRIKYLLDSPKNWDAFYSSSFEDKPIMPIVSMVRNLLSTGQYNIAFCTGRRESIRDITEKWIVLHFGDIPHDLIMRPNEDFRHDTIVKPFQLKWYMLHPGNVSFILEDRTSMVKRWRELGFTCLQVADGDF